MKIGYRDRPDARRRKPEKHYGRSLVILATIDGGPEGEAALWEVDPASYPSPIDRPARGIEG